MYENNPFLASALELTDGEGDVTFKRLDGKTVTFYNVRVDSVGPSAENPGVVGVEFYGNDELVHVPFVESWTFDYRW